MIKRQFKLPPSERTQQILSAALNVAERQGFSCITAADIGHAAGVAPSLVTYHLALVGALRDRIMQEAVNTCRLRVIAQGLAVSHPVALAAPDAVRRAAIHYLATAQNRGNT